MTFVAQALTSLGWILRSGGANGADKAFEAGVENGDSKHIYLPWRNFNQNASSRYTPSPEAYQIASKIHPYWARCGRGAQALHARNVHQVLGDDLTTPSEFLLCWTKNGEPVGGTRTAIVVAFSHEIPVINLATVDLSDKNVLQNWISGVGAFPLGNLRR